eukprot:4467785-Pleurochrysis_carterae.AAC.1
MLPLRVHARYCARAAATRSRARINARATALHARQGQEGVWGTQRTSERAGVNPLLPPTEDCGVACAGVAPPREGVAPGVA